MQNLLKKYDNLRQEFWTHFLSFIGYIYFFLYLWIYDYACRNSNSTGDGDFIAIYLIILGIVYVSSFVFIPVLIILNLFFNKKITNKFLTQNKIYCYIWKIGLILWLGIFVLTCLLYFFRHQL